ncbi:MAG: TolC family protein [Acidobacteria bacterium]|nr:TolC family protein [Acidobacteriota bacterium]
MPILIRIGVGTISIVFCLFVSASAQELTEKEAVRLFLTSSPYAQESRAGTAVVEAQTLGWHLWPNPVAAYNHEGAGLTEISSVQQHLPLSGRLGFLRRAGAAAVKVAGTQAEYDIWKLCSEMRQAFYSLLLAQQREAILRDGLAQLQEVVRILREREQGGEGSLFDRLRTEREQADLQAEIMSLRASTAQARARLASFFDGKMDPASLRARGEFDAAKDQPGLADLVESAIQNRPDSQAEKHRQEQFQWEQRAATRLRIPEPAISAGFKRGEQLGGISYGPYIGFSLNLPIFDHGQNRVAELDAQLRRASYRREVLDQQIQTEIKGAYEAMLARRQAAEEYRVQFTEDGPQLENIAQVGYEEGELGILELLDAYRLRRVSLVRMLDLLAAWKQAGIDLERAVGKPVLSPEVLP